MILNLIVILAVVITAAVWGSKAKGYGLFSAFLALVSTIAAGGVAFAAWEPTALALLNASRDGGSFFEVFLQDTAWCLGLLGPFLISLLVFRLMIDMTVKKNLAFSDNANTIGGLAIGAVIGVLTAGVAVVSVGYMRMPPAILGYRPIEEVQGNPVYAHNLWLPVDRIVVRFYEKLSTGAFASSTPLALRRPSAHQQAGMQRMTFKGLSRVSLAPADFHLLGRYRIEGEAVALLKDSFQGKQQTAIYPDNTSPGGRSVLEGYVIRFESTAKEKGGNFVAAPGQLRLICEKNGYPIALHPIAVVAQPDAATAGLYRFRFDASEAFISSVGGGSDSTFAFEFILPEGAVPVDLLVKNARVSVAAESAIPETTYRSTDHRDTAVRDGSIVSSFGSGGGAAAGALDSSGVVRITPNAGLVAGISVSKNFPNGATLNKSNRGGITVNEENEVMDGERQFTKAQMSERGLDKNLRVDSFAASKDTSVVQVTLSELGARTSLGDALENADSTRPPFLIDNHGARFELVGYYYTEGELIKFRFTPGQPIRSLSETPTLSRTKRDQSLIYLYRPTKGVNIVSFAIEGKELVNFGTGVNIR